MLMTKPTNKCEGVALPEEQGKYSSFIQCFFPDVVYGCEKRMLRTCWRIESGLSGIEVIGGIPCTVR